MIKCRVFTCNVEAVWHLWVKIDGRLQDCGPWCMEHGERAVLHLDDSQFRMELLVA